MPASGMLNYTITTHHLSIYFLNKGQIMKKLFLFSCFSFLGAKTLSLESIVNTQEDINPSVQNQKIQNVMSEEVTQKYNINSTTQLNNYFSNLRIYAQGSDTFPMVSFRGVSSPDYYSSVIGVYVDEIPQNPNFLIQNLSDIKSISLIGGAEGLFYGENAPLGLLDIKTKNPLSGNYVDFFTTFSRLREDINAQIGYELLQNKLWAKANFRYIKDNGFIKDLQSQKMLNGANSFNVGTTFYYQPIESILLSASYSFYHTFSRKDFFLTKNQMQNLTLKSDENITWEEFIQGEQDKILNKTPFLNLFSHNANIKLQYFGDSFNLKYISAFAKNDTLANSYPGIYVKDEKNDGYYYNTTQVIQELRLHTNHTKNIQSLFGIYYKFLALDNGMHNVPTDSVLGYSGNWNAKEDLNTFALYANTSFAWNDFTLHTGVRYQFFHTRIQSLRPPVADILPYSNDAIFQALNPRISLYYQPSEITKFFIEMSNSTKPGGFSKFPFADTDTIAYGNEQIYSLELGNKTSLLQSRLKLKTIFYTTLRTNTQSYVGVGYYKSIKNIGSAYAIGVDFKADYNKKFFSSFISANLGISKFVNGGANKGSITILGNEGLYDLSGLTPKFAPIFSFNIGNDFILFKNNAHEVSFSTLLNFSSSYYLDDFNRDNDMLQKAYVLLDFGVNYHFAKHYNFAIFAQNILDTRYVTTVIWDSLGKAFVVRDPMNFGLKFSCNF